MKINEILELTPAQYQIQAGIEIFLIHVVTAEICTAHAQLRSKARRYYYYYTTIGG